MKTAKFAQEHAKLLKIPQLISSKSSNLNNSVIQATSQQQPSNDFYNFRANL